MTRDMWEHMMNMELKKFNYITRIGYIFYYTTLLHYGGSISERNLYSFGYIHLNLQASIA